MVRSINEIGHLTGKQTIAEFAENAEIITMLRGMGIDYRAGLRRRRAEAADPGCRVAARQPAQISSDASRSCGEWLRRAPVAAR